jgi:hypothetical protein
MAALRLLRFRTQHKLQGFSPREASGGPRRRTITGRGVEFLALPAAEQDSIFTGGADNIITRLESPAERFCRKLQGVERTVVDDDLLVYIEGPRQRVRVRDGKIVVRDTARFGQDELVFREPHHALLEEEHEGKEFEAAIAREGDRIVLTREGRILGSVAAQGRVVRGTEEAKREMGRVRAARTADREHLRGYYAGGYRHGARRAARAQHGGAGLAGAGRRGGRDRDRGKANHAHPREETNRGAAKPKFRPFAPARGAG